MISFGTFHHLGTSPGGRVAGAERKRFVSRKHVVSVGRFLGRQVLGNAKAVFFGKIKRDQMTSPQKGLVAGCLFFGGTWIGKKPKDLFAEWSERKRENIIIRTKIYNLENYKSKDNLVNGIDC